MNMKLDPIIHTNMLYVYAQLYITIGSGIFVGIKG